MFRKTERNIEKSTIDKQNKKFSGTSKNQRLTSKTKNSQNMITSEPKSIHELQSRHQNITLTLLEKTLRNIEKAKAEQQKNENFEQG